jgi:hypothetical protein
MFAGLAGHNTDNGMPMIRGCDEYRIDIFAVKDSAEISIAVGLALKPPDRQIHEGLINIGYGSNLAAGVLHADFEFVLAATAQTNLANADAVVGSFYFT